MTAQPVSPLSPDEALTAWQNSVADAYDQISRALAAPSATRAQRACAVVEAVAELNEAGARLIEEVARGPWGPGKAQRWESGRAV